MRIRVPDAGTTDYAVQTTNIRTANRIFMNGKEIGSSGVPEVRDGAGKAGNTPYIGVSTVTGEMVELIVQVSNYDYSSGGIIYPIEFGDVASILESRDVLVFEDYTAFAGFAGLALLFLILFLFRRQERSLLYIGLFSAAAVVYVVTHGNKLLATTVPELSYEAITKLQFISAICCYYLLLRYVDVSSPGLVQRYVVTAAKALTLGLLLVVLAAKASFYSAWSSVVFTDAFATTGYVLYVMLRWLRRHRDDAIPMLVGMQGMAFSIVLNTLNVIGMLENQSLFLFELLLFVAAQLFLLAKRFAR
jgi:hypothetical protein